MPTVSNTPSGARYTSPDYGTHTVSDGSRPLSGPRPGPYCSPPLDPIESIIPLTPAPSTEKFGAAHTPRGAPGHSETTPTIRPWYTPLYSPAETKKHGALRWVRQVLKHSPRGQRR